ncbi:hypothetical protein [Aquimarina sp. 2201CG14-23]|uniref:hypothetical protein n=1 Tax=Aquimarina mycalae TaxID=3040073 RepID=UPI00247818BE|nr:hypothetical protein [Aquimarina sp. 2201CG14-23]MDH7446052.1 hypothetical protein [Aquimarina sp. 2201CG14-23]
MKLFKKQIDPNLLIAIGVLIASFAALFVYMRQAAIMSEQTEILLQQTKANSWPYLDLSYSYNSSGKNDSNKKYSLSVVNKGTGPAIIQNVSISYNNKLVRNWKEFHATLNIPDSILKIGYIKSSISNKVISPNENITFINWSGNSELVDIIRKNAGKIKVSICYKSVFNEFWNLERIGFDGNTKKVTYSEPETCVSNNDTFEN